MLVKHHLTKPYVLGHFNSFVSKKLGQVVTFDQQAALLGVKLLPK